MKDKRLDALLETLPPLICNYYEDISKSYKDPPKHVCTMEPVGPGPHTPGKMYPLTQCQGDIRKCEREE